MNCEISVDLKIKEITSSVLSLPLEKINDNLSPANCDQWDSLRHMNLISAIEDQFEISFSDHEMSEMINLIKITILTKAKLK